jgi:hypothetical protein
MINKHFIPGLCSLVTLCYYGAVRILSFTYKVDSESSRTVLIKNRESTEMPTAKLSKPQ